MGQLALLLIDDFLPFSFLLDLLIYFLLLTGIWNRVQKMRLEYQRKENNQIRRRIRKNKEILKNLSLLPLTRGEIQSKLLRWLDRRKACLESFILV